MNRIVDMCPLTKLEGGLNLLREADDHHHHHIFVYLKVDKRNSYDAVISLKSTATAAFAKQIPTQTAGCFMRIVKIFAVK